MAAIKKDPETTSTVVGLGALLDAGDGAVVTLVAGETQLAVHRAVLAANSPVFEAMFLNDMLESSSGQVVITDIEGPVLRELLAYCYTKRGPQVPTMAHSLLAAANKYGVLDLKLACERHVAAHLTVENAAAAAVLAVRHCCQNLKQAAIAFVKAHTHEVMATQGWADAVLRQPKDVVEVSRLLTVTPAETSVEAAEDHSTTNAVVWTTTECARDVRDTSYQPFIHCSCSWSSGRRHTPPLSRITSQSLRCEEERGRRLLQAAKAGTTVEEVQTLIAAGADVMMRDEKESTPLHWAAVTGDLEVVRCLLENGAEVNARDVWQSTPLHYAAESGQAAVVQLLSAFHADPNARVTNGYTPLHWAAYYGHEETVVALLDAGADRLLRDASQDRPLQLAIQNNHHHLVHLLT